MRDRNCGMARNVMLRPRGGTLANIGRFAYGAVTRYGPRVAQMAASYYTRSGGGKAPFKGGKKRVSDPLPATNQYDVKVRYAKRRMPRRKRNNWKSFTKKVHAVLNKNVAPTYFLFRETSVCSSTAGTQAWASVMLYTGNQGSAPNNDIGRIASGTVGALGNQVGTKYRFEAGILDLLMRNTGTATAIVDVYTIYCRKDVPNTYQSPFSLITNLDSTANQDGNADTIISDNDIGYTPFHCPLFCSYYKVGKKTTLILSSGQISELQMKDPGNKNLWGIDYISKSSLRGWTKGYLICVRGAFDGLTTPGVSVGLAYTRSYTLREINDKTWVSAKV